MDSPIDKGDSASPGADHRGLTRFEAAVVAVVEATGPGDVMSYGEVATEAGYPGAARAVGGVLKRVDGLAWWRIVTANGRLVPHGVERQADHLRAEGVTVVGDRVVLSPPAAPGHDSQS